MNEEEDKESQTEEATPKKIEDARKQGKSINSREVTTFTMFFTFTLFICILVPAKIHDITSYLRYFIENNDQITLFNISPQAIFIDIFYNLFFSCIFPFLILMVIIAFSFFAQQEGQIYISAAPLMPKLSKISPLAGLKRMFSLKSLLEFIKGILKISIIGFILYLVILKDIKYYLILYQYETIDISKSIINIIKDLLIAITIITFVLGIIDYFYQRYDFYASLRMTKQQLKEEYKDTEGNPEVKSKLKNLRMDMVRKRMMGNVSKADAVITNPTHYSVAIEYKADKMKTPVVVAKGQDLIALKIRELAKEYNIPIIENPPLARSLYDSIAIDQEIKSEHYEAVAKIINYIYKLKKKKF